LARDDLIQIKGTITEALAGGKTPRRATTVWSSSLKIGGRTRYHIRVIPGS
jgi:hypothetical protein